MAALELGVPQHHLHPRHRPQRHDDVRAGGLQRAGGWGWGGESVAEGWRAEAALRGAQGCTEGGIEALAALAHCCACRGSSAAAPHLPIGKDVERGHADGAVVVDPHPDLRQRLAGGHDERDLVAGLVGLLADPGLPAQPRLGLLVPRPADLQRLLPLLLLLQVALTAGQ